MDTVATYQLDFSHCRTKPYDHQKLGVKALFEQRVFMLADEMGAGKTKQTIDAAQFLFQYGFIKKVLIVAPAAVRDVWFNPEFGELEKHLWKDRQAGSVVKFHATKEGWAYGPADQPKLFWVITNIEFIRSRNRLDQLLPFADASTLLVIDESSTVKNHRAQQSKACLILRKRCGRVLLLNGTPISNSPLDMYSQGNIMDPRILGCQSYFHFRSRYAVMGGYMNKQIKGWVNLEDMQRRFAPFVLRRLKKDCLDLPEKLPPVRMTVPLTPETWHLYKEMRDELVAFITQNQMSTAIVPIVKVLRLAQLTSGFLGGVQELNIFEDDEDRPDWVPSGNGSAPPQQPVLEVQAVGREKLDFFLEWLQLRLEENPKLKLLVWSRFRPEVKRLFAALSQIEGLNVGLIIGAQKRAEREYSLRLLDPRTAPQGPVVVVGTPQTGALGLNLAAASTVIYISNDYSLKTRLQSEDRVHRPGQVSPVSYFDILATGPNGQKTIDHNIIRALFNKENVATRTTSAWVQALREE